MLQFSTQVNAVIRDETEQSKIDLSIGDYYIVPQSCIEAFSGSDALNWYKAYVIELNN